MKEAEHGLVFSRQRLFTSATVPLVCTAADGASVKATTADPCANNPCQNHGTCIPRNSSDGARTEHRSSFTCQCPKYFEGELCQDGILTVRVAFRKWLHVYRVGQKSKLLILSVNKTEKIGAMWTNINSYRENEVGLSSDILTWNILRHNCFMFKYSMTESSQWHYC